jgi:hypothetical protein
LVSERNDSPLEGDLPKTPGGRGALASKEWFALANKPLEPAALK